jgi:hypothetical protein
MTTYREYYAACREAYAGRNDEVDVFRLGAHSQVPRRSAPDAPFALPNEYERKVHELAAEVDRRIANEIGIWHERDHDVQELAIKLDDFWDIAALEVIALLLIPQVEEKVLGSYAVINQVNLIRSLPNGAKPVSSWLWHYDNCPDVSFKILIYLSDVDADSGAFEYLRRPNIGDVVKLGSSRVSWDQVLPPLWPQSRVPPDVISRCIADGYEPYRVVGPRGTLILFDNNCIHRATVPVTRHRDALILNFRPTDRPVRPCISRRHTGSWSFNAKQWVPEVLDIVPVT